MKRYFIIFIVGISIFFGGFFIEQYWDSVSDRLMRMKRNFMMSDGRQRGIERYAGCQLQTMIDTESDQVFSDMWKKDSTMYNFDTKDVDEWMMVRCSPPSIVEFTTNKIHYSETRTRGMIQYQYKFLQRDFTVLKNEPKSDFLSEIVSQ
jgi:hypothetical protein